MIEETVRVDSQSARVVDGPTDDYECWRGGLSGALHRCEMIPYVPSGLWNPRVEQDSRPV